MTKDNYVKIKIRWVIRDHFWNIFLCQLRDLGFYCLPWGTLEPWETRVECLWREIYEELWIQPDIGELMYVQEFVRDGSTTIDFWYEIRNFEDFKNIDIASTTHGFELSQAKFISINSLETIEVKPHNLGEIIAGFTQKTI